MTAPKVTFHPRESLRLVSPNASRLSRRSPADAGVDHLGFTAHWTGAGGRLFRPNPVTRLQGIQGAHMAPGGLGTKNGAGDIAYEGAFDADANTYGLRDSRFVGAHALSNDNQANRQTDGIVFLEDERGWTDGAAAAWAWWCDLYRFVNHRDAHVFTHDWWARSIRMGTACPGPQFTATVKARGGCT